MMKHRTHHLKCAMDNARLTFTGETDNVGHASTGTHPGHTTHHFHIDADHVVVHARKHPNGHIEFKPSITTYSGGSTGEDKNTTHHDWTHDAVSAFKKLNHEHYKVD